MMSLGESTMPMKDLVAECTLTVHITGKRAAIWRLRAANAIIRIASKVGGVGIKIVED